MKGVKFVYEDGYVRGARIKHPRAPIPPLDTIKVHIKRRKPGREVLMYMRPDEAVALAATLMAAVWDHLVNP